MQDDNNIGFGFPPAHWFPTADGTIRSRMTVELTNRQTRLENSIAGLQDRTFAGIDEFKRDQIAKDSVKAYADVFMYGSGLIMVGKLVRDLVNHPALRIHLLAWASDVTAKVCPVIVGGGFPPRYTYYNRHGWNGCSRVKPGTPSSGSFETDGRS